jgi:hypothetical protein
MVMVYVLLAAHFLADFICQSDWMALNKSKRWDALGVHVLVYVAVLGVCASPWASSNDGALWLLVNAAAHFVTDAITSRITSRLWFISFYPRPDEQKDTYGVFATYGAYPLYAAVDTSGKRHWFFVAIGADQLIHAVTLIATAEWLLS